jgi:hypothetical protein
MTKKETEIHPSIYYLSSSSLLDRLILLTIYKGQLYPNITEKLLVETITWNFVPTKH